MARFMPRSSTAISAPSCIARTMTVSPGRKSPAPAFRRMRAGAPSLFQMWMMEPAAPRSPDGCGSAPFRPGCSARTIAARPGSSSASLWDVPERAKWFGGGYDDAGIHSISPDPRDPRHVFVAISCGGVWETRDDGASWTLQGEGMIADYMPPEQAGTRRSRTRTGSRAAPPRPTCCGAASQRHLPLDRRRRDLDAAASRRATISASRSRRIRTIRTPPGSCPAIKDEVRMPRDGALAVTRTRDGGKSFDVLREGLPQRDAYDLVYRHGLDVDATGSRLRWARPPARCGPATTAASAGSSSTRTCRRSIRYASPERDGGFLQPAARERPYYE